MPNTPTILGINTPFQQTVSAATAALLDTAVLAAVNTLIKNSIGYTVSGALSGTQNIIRSSITIHSVGNQQANVWSSIIYYTATVDPT